MPICQKLSEYKNVKMPTCQKLSKYKKNNLSNCQNVNMANTNIFDMFYISCSFSGSAVLLFCQHVKMAKYALNAFDLLPSSLFLSSISTLLRVGGTAAHSGASAALQ